MPRSPNSGDDESDDDVEQRRAGLASRLGTMAHSQAQSRIKSLPARTAPSVLQIEMITTEHSINVSQFTGEMSPLRPEPAELGKALLQGGLERLQTPDEKAFTSFWRNSIMPTTFHEKPIQNDKGEVIGTRNVADRGIGIPALSPSRNMLPESYLQGTRKKEPYMAYLQARRDKERALRDQAFGGKGFDSLGPLVRTPGSRSRSRVGTRDGDKSLWASRPVSKELTPFSLFGDPDTAAAADIVVKRVRPQALSLQVSGIADTSLERAGQRAQARRWLSKTLGATDLTPSLAVRPNTNLINTSALHGNIMDNVMDLRLARQGIGDRLGIELAQTIEAIPRLIHIDLTENRLTDVSLRPIIKAVADRSDVETLTLGENKIDRAAAEALRWYIRDSGCRLKSLGLSHADVDDEELTSFVVALEHNHYLTSLDLSRNLIGQKGGEGSGVPILAEFLENHACHLQFLDISWNFVKGADAERLGRAIGWNETLTHLDLTGNSFSCKGTQAIAQGLSENASLTRLDLGQNNIDGRGLFTLLALIMHRNKSLTTLDLSGNSTLGDHGPAVLMSTMVKLIKRSFGIVIKGCNFALKDPECWYDVQRPIESLRSRASSCPRNPPGFETHTSLCLSDSYDWAVAVHLCMCAAENPSICIVSAKYTAVEKGELRGTTEIRLERRIDYDNVHMKQAQHARSFLSRNAAVMFERYDEDRSGYIDKQELKKILRDLNVADMDAEAFDHLVARYDVDGSGVLEESEFNRLIKDLPDDLERRVERHSYMTQEGDPTPFEPPKTGRLFILVRLVAKEAAVQESTTGRDISRLLPLVKTCSSSTVKLLSAGLRLLSLQVDEAVAVVEFLANEMGTLNEALSKVLLSMATPEHARVLVDKYLKTSEQKRLLQKTMGSAYWPSLGVLTQKYRLNMQFWKDQNVFIDLKMYDCFQKRHRKTCDLNTTSRDLDWINFRNVVWEGSSTVLTDDFIDPLPCRGILEFDYVNSVDLGEESEPCSAVRFLTLMHSLRWSTTEEEDAILAEIRKPIADTEFAADEYRSLKLAECLARENRCETIRRPYKPIQTTHSRSNSKDSGSRRGSKEGKAEAAESGATSSSSANPVAAGKLPKLGSFKSKFKSATRKMSTTGLLRADKNEPMWSHGLLPGLREKFNQALTKKMPSTKQQAESMLFEALHACSCRWFTARQGETLIMRSPLKDAQIADFEWRTELAVLLFNRTVDMENYGLVLGKLNPAEAAKVIHRIGWLNLFNPLRPDGHYELMLNRPDERQLCKLLVHMSLAEGGGRWKKQRLSWNRAAEDIPAWSLNEVWFQEAGIPTKGCVSFEYVSDGNADWALRLCLCSCVRYAPTDSAIAKRGRSTWNISAGVVLTRRQCVSLQRLRTLMGECPVPLSLEYGGRPGSGV